MSIQMKPINLKKRRWIMLVGGIMLMSTLAWSFTWSLMVGPMIEQRGATDNLMATLYSAVTIVGALFTIVGGKLIDKIGTTKVLLSAIIAFFIGQMICGMTSDVIGFAIGKVLFVSWQQSVLYIAVYSNIIRLFPDWRGLATGLVGMGIPIGGSFMAPLAQFCIEKFGFNSMFFATGFLLAILALVGLLVFPQTKGIDLNTALALDEKKVTNPSTPNPNFVQKDWKKMLKDPVFYLVFLMPLFGTTTYMLLSYQMAWIAQDMLGVSEMQSAFLVSLVSIVGMVTVAVGPISDRFGRLGITVILFGVGAIACAGFIVAPSYGLPFFVACVILYVATIGSFGYIHPVLVSDLFGTENYGFNYSICYQAVLIAATISPWLGVLGRTGEQTDYTLTFTIATAMSAAGFVCALIVFMLRRKNVEYIPKGLGKKA